jgi:Rod binding domain-containing protein
MSETPIMQGVTTLDGAMLSRTRLLLTPPRSGAANSDGAIRKAAQSFEAVLLTSLFQQMQESVAALNSQHADSAQSSFQGLGAQELASGIAASGGIGIANMIMPFLSRSR